MWSLRLPRRERREDEFEVPSASQFSFGDVKRSTLVHVNPSNHWRESDNSFLIHRLLLYNLLATSFLACELTSFRVIF